MRRLLAIAAVLTASIGTAWAQQFPTSPVLVGVAPGDQTAFMAAIDKYRDAYKAAQDDLRKSLARTERGQALATILKPTKGVVREWVGTIGTLKTTGDGKAYVVITLARRLAVQTWNNSASDSLSGDNTLIEQTSPLFKAMLDMKAGDKVIFGAVFKPDAKDGWKEVSLSEDGAMTDPAFLMKVGEIRKVP